jgi:PASTA domain
MIISPFVRKGIICCAAILASLSICASADADITIGQVAPPNPESYCNLGPTDTIQIATTGGNLYAMPEAGVLTSWSTSAGPGAGQFLSFKVYRPVSGTVFSVVAQDGPRALVPSVLNTFPIDIPVQAGDVLGLNDHEAPTTPDACSYFTGAPGDREAGLLGNGADGAQLNFEASDTEPNVRANVSATLLPTLAAVPVTTPVGPPVTVPKCVVPRLGAKKLAAARKALKKADCKLGRVTKLKGATTKTGLVVSQNPQTGKKLAAGAKVAVKLVPPGSK